MLFRKKEINQCWIFAEQVYNIITKNEPTAFFTFTAYYILPEIYIRLLQDHKYWKEGDFVLGKKEITTRAEKSVAALHKFSQVFTFAQCHYLMWNAGLKFLSGKEKKAESDWSKSIELAKALSHYEEAYVYFMKGTLSGKNEDIVTACKLFPEIKTLGNDLTSLKLKLLKSEKN